MVQLHRADTVLPARSLGETYRNENGEALKTYPKRRCAQPVCITILSTYNSGDYCGPCNRAEAIAQDSANPTRIPVERLPYPRTVICGFCGGTFKTQSKRRRTCYVCWPDTVR